MEFKNDGLTLVYDTLEAPVPKGVMRPNQDVSISAILKPSHPKNTIIIPYRINGGPVQAVQVLADQTEYKNGAQLFRATIPDLKGGDSVDYAVTGECTGREVPKPLAARTLPHSFQFGLPNEGSNNTSPTPSFNAQTSGAIPDRFPVTTEFLARFTITIQEPRLVGPSPDGIRVTWNAVTGTVIGPRLKAKVLQGADWMQIRPDGIGNIDVRALLETDEGVRIMSVYSGVMELGEDGYQGFLRHKITKPLRAWTNQRFLTAEKTYAWLNRPQFISVGEVFMEELRYIYDVYALT